MGTMQDSISVSALNTCFSFSLLKYLDKPFFILATQNPIEQAGTYPLPEAQLDRFLLYIKIGYPTAAEEIAILTSNEI